MSVSVEPLIDYSALYPANLGSLSVSVKPLIDDSALYPANLGLCSVFITFSLPPSPFCARPGAEL